MVESLRIGICPPQALESHPRVDAEMTGMCVRTFLARECASKKFAAKRQKHRPLANDSLGSTQLPRRIRDVGKKTSQVSLVHHLVGNARRLKMGGGHGPKLAPGLVQLLREWPSWLAGSEPRLREDYA
jgi:hypothetical protein